MVKCPNCGFVWETARGASCPECRKSLDGLDAVSQPSETGFANGPPPPPSAADPASLEDAFSFALERLRQGEKQLTIRKDLLNAGYSPTQIEAIISRAITFRVDNREYKQQKPKVNPKKSIGYFLCLIGLAITIGTYALSAHVGVYVIAWGPILSGLVLILNGNNEKTESR